MLTYHAEHAPLVVLDMGADAMAQRRAGFSHVDNQTSPLLGRDGFICATGDGTVATLRAAYGEAVNFALAKTACRAGPDAATEPADATGAWADPEWTTLVNVSRMSRVTARKREGDWPSCFPSSIQVSRSASFLFHPPGFFQFLDHSEPVAVCVCLTRLFFFSRLRVFFEYFELEN